MLIEGLKQNYEDNSTQSSDQRRFTTQMHAYIL